MPRDNKAEAAWAKQRYKRFEARLLPRDADMLDGILSRGNYPSFGEWVRKNIDRERKENGN